MNLSREGAMELIGHEGIVLTRYKDSVGVWTIGVGHTRAAGSPDPETFLGELSVARCFELFQQDVQRYVADVNRAVKVKCTQAQFDSMVSFHFNTGAIERASFVRKLNEGDIEGAAEGMMAWVNPPEIIGRRAKERDLFATGRYSNGGKVNVFPATPEGRVIWNKPQRADLRAALGVIPPPPDVSKPVNIPVPAPKPKKDAVPEVVGGGAVITTGGVVVKGAHDSGLSTGDIVAIAFIFVAVAIFAVIGIRKLRGK